MVTDSRMIGRLTPDDIQTDKVFYECWAGVIRKYITVTEPEEVNPGIWKWKAMNLDYDHIPYKKKEVTEFTYNEKTLVLGPYLFDYPAYIPIDKNDGVIF